MGRFLLFVLVAGAVALYFTNPSTDEVRAKLGGQIPAAMSAPPAAPDLPAPPPAPDQPAPPAGMPAAPPAPDMPGVPPAVTDQLQGDMQFERKDYYLFSVYKISAGGHQLPGCVIGIAKQVMPYDKC